jgi:CheY-like chemotaxis protein
VGKDELVIYPSGTEPLKQGEPVFVSVKVLIVEDDAPTLELMSEVLSSLKADVRAVSDSEAASALVNQERFDGIFLDLQMPKVDGFELARRIRKSSWNKSAPIVVVTGADDVKTMEKAFTAGTTFFLQKPVDRQRLTNLFKAARGTMFENRRHFVRVPLQTEVSCHVGEQTFQGMSSNISQGGILFEMGRSLPVGALVRLSFRLPGRELRIDTTAVVVRVDNLQRIGVRFSQIDGRELQLIRDLIGSDDSDSPQTVHKPT